MEILRGEAAQKAVGDLSESAQLVAIQPYPPAGHRGAAELIAVASPTAHVLVDAAHSPHWAASIPQGRPLAACDAKKTEHALWDRFKAGAERWACATLSAQLLAGGRPIDTAFATMAKAAGLAPPEGAEDLVSLAATARCTAALLIRQGQSLKDAGLGWTSKIEAACVAPLAAVERAGMPLQAAAWRQVVAQEAALASRLRGQLLRRPGDVAHAAQGDTDVAHAMGLGQTSLLTLGKHAADAAPQWARHNLRELIALRRLHATVGEGFLRHVGPDGRVHPTFAQIGSSTGRMACTAPNLQGMHSSDARRRCFAPQPGRCLVVADYRACELRILADMSADKAFCAAFAANDDVHARIASVLFGVNYEQGQSSKYRQPAKALAFGLIYGMGPATLSKATHTSLAGAKELMARFFAAFPQVEAFLHDGADEAHRRGWAQTVTGRRLYLDQAKDRGYALRLARNMPIQGTSADIIKRALALAHADITGLKGCHVVHCVHDELVVEGPCGQGPELAAKLSRAMEQAGRDILRNVALRTDVAICDHWGK